MYDFGSFHFLTISFTQCTEAWKALLFMNRITILLVNIFLFIPSNNLE